MHLCLKGSTPYSIGDAIESEKEISDEDCRMCHDQKMFVTKKGEKIPLKIGVQNEFKFYSLGKQFVWSSRLAAKQVSCEGETYITLNGSVIENMVFINDIKLTLVEHNIFIGHTKVFSPLDDIWFNCISSFQTHTCISSGSTFLWEKDKPTCMLVGIRIISGEIISELEDKHAFE